MKRFRRLACAAMFCLPAARPATVQAWLGSDSGPDSGAQTTALLWVPDMGSIDWFALEEFLKDNKDARFSLGLMPGSIPDEVKPWLKEAVESGQVEPVLRLPGDPILPLIPNSQYRAVIEQLALGRTAHKAVFGEFPAGILPGGGALTPSAAAPMAAQGLDWAAVGDAEFKRPWYGEGRLKIVPFHTAASTDPIAIVQTLAPALVLDERGGIPRGAGLALLKELLDRGGTDRWTTVAALLDLQDPYAVGPRDWPAFGGGLARWETAPEQQAAWAMLRKTADALSRYQNSGSASLWVLNKAGRSLYAAMDSAFFLPGAISDPSRDKEFRGLLTKVYRAVGKRPPPALGRPVSASQLSAAAQDEPEDAAPIAEEKRLRVTMEEGRVLFENPLESEAALPAELPELPAGTTPQSLWTPRFLDITWDEAAVRFTIGIESLSVSPDAPFGFDKLLADLYIDLNHLARRGSTRLLPYRKGFVSSNDAWEFAVVICGWSAGLYRSIPGHPARLLEELPLEADLENATVSVRVPASRLRGNPAAWGYLLTTMASDPEGIERRPPRPSAGAHGTAILGLLGHSGEQKRLHSGNATRKPFAAVRTDSD